MSHQLGVERGHAVIEWLLAGDPVIRWQVMRDLLDEPTATWERERARVVEMGWAADLLAFQGSDGEWPKGRWTASVWTLLLLVQCGIPEGHPAARRPLESLLGRFMPAGEEVDGAFLLKRVDVCHLGFWLGLGAHFLVEDPRLPPLGEALLSAQFDDGGWNCQMRNYPSTRHSSFHTTFNVLESLRIATARGVVGPRIPRRRDAGGRVHALPSPVPLRPHGRGDLGEVHSSDVPMALALHRPSWARLPTADPGDLRRATRRSHRPAAREAQAERALATGEANPRNVARRDGEARPGESLEHTPSAPCSAATRPPHACRRGSRGLSIDSTATNLT